MDFSQKKKKKHSFKVVYCSAEYKSEKKKQIMIELVQMKWTVVKESTVERTETKWNMQHLSQWGRKQRGVKNMPMSCMWCNKFVLIGI